MVPRAFSGSALLLIEAVSGGAAARPTTLKQPVTYRVPPEVVARRLQAAPDGDFFLLGLGFGSTLSRLRPDGTLNLDFVPPADRQSTYYTGDLNLMPDGRVTVAGLASAFYGLLSAGPLWRLNPDGSLDAGSNVSNSAASFGTLQSADAISTAPDGRVLVAGAFSTGSSSIWTVRRLNADGSSDWSFDPGTGLTVSPTSGYPNVNALAALPSGGWLAGGEFGGYNGFNQRYLVKVLPETLLQPHTFAFAEVFSTSTALCRLSVSGREVEGRNRRRAHLGNEDAGDRQHELKQVIQRVVLPLLARQKETYALRQKLPSSFRAFRPRQVACEVHWSFSS